MFRRLAARAAVLATAVCVLGGGYTLAAPAPQAQYPGYTRPAVVTRPDAYVATSMVPIDLVGMVTVVTIPAGKSADLTITLSAVPEPCATMYARAIVQRTGRRPVVAGPGEVAFAQFGGGAESHAFTWYRKVGAGDFVIRIKWRGSHPCATSIGRRTLMVDAYVYS